MTSMIKGNTLSYYHESSPLFVFIVQVSLRTPRVERVAQSISKQVEGEHRQQQRGAREDHVPPRRVEDRRCRGDHLAPARRRRSHADAQERQRGLEQDV